ncbi:RDD domain containing protein [Thermoclostridium stercorarium subsp. stercorarium DSM 8532]|uniref:RDD domain containing protein n=1 Tax=Thermoclostridium stercorarium (strain ATCC 35414 / DSM 8532 / NCIMB 11754) TaxID=1121335 RepID=L7VMK5_THES1|nr:RDD family protein [Thermoclostridium stercorarium]AGC67691.1 RDD domain containing protein [Thermoclostridium stercorarium subsp. stercorarium DSM 8532]AGI38739.1 membrane protein [Thermoclostridium stercorarium subsp. stercorarium DSM 8532]
MRNVYHVKTPENVTLEYELAGIGSRGVAVIIDTLIQNFLLLMIALMILPALDNGSFFLIRSGENTLYVVIAILLMFIVQFGYFLLFEFFMKGATPGKRIVGLKVIMANGEPVTFTAVVIRNLLRIGDMLPGIYGVGILSVFLNKRYMRVGDLAANTVVIKENKRNIGFLSIRRNEPGQSSVSISHREEALLMEYAERIRDMKNPLDSAILEYRLYRHFYGKLGVLPNLPEKYNAKIYLRYLLDLIGIPQT